MREKRQLTLAKALLILSLIWLGGAICDRLWYAWDSSVPTWDRADYLNGVLNYAEALQTPQWLSGEWWRSFWLLSNKIPPLNYILTAPLVNWFGTTEDAAALIMLFYSGVLLLSVFGLGWVLFDLTTGLWAAGLCQLIPGLYYHRLEFLLDYPLTTSVSLSYCLLTGYFLTKDKFKSWIWGIFWGISFGLAMLMKQTALFFLFLPLVWVALSWLKQRQWLRLVQLGCACLTSIAVAFPWYRTNWLLILTSGKRATVDSAIAEGDPALNTLAAWTYYGKILPYLLSWHLLLIPLVGLSIYLIRKYLFQKNSSQNSVYANSKTWIWIGVYLIGGYLLSSLNINKDARYILPLLPVLSLVLAVGLLAWRNRWQKLILTVTASLGVILMLLNIFPLGGKAIASTFNPRTQRYPYTGQPYYHSAVIQEIDRISPYLRTVLGVLPSTPEINQHNFSFYGKQNNTRISGRQVGVREAEILQDSRSLDWFLTKTGEQGSIPESQPAMVDLVTQGEDFKLQKSWQLPDDSQLQLYHRDRPIVEVRETNKNPTTPVSLTVSLPEASPGSIPIPVTYNWIGKQQTLHSGIVLLTWKQENNPDAFWIHDRAIGGGAILESESAQQKTLEVTERIAMLPPTDTPPGKYYLAATYLDRYTGKTQAIDLPPTTITIDPQAAATPAPELDLVTQLRTTAPKMAENIQGLDPVFIQTARINQYDARQDYLQQAEISLSYRLEHQQVSFERQRDWLYTLALARVLQQDVDGAITTFSQITKLDPENPYGYAYLAFVHLYDWQPKPANKALDLADKINPDIPEVKTLQGAAAVMQGRFFKAWKLLITDY